MGYIDLHVHSTCSDGKRTPSQLIDIALQNDVTTMALADHYSMAGYKEARDYSEGRVEIIPAIEIGTSMEDLGYSNRHVCHIVVYYPTTRIGAILDEYEQDRRRVVEDTLYNLKKIGIHLPMRKVRHFARNKDSIGRYDIAITLCRLGYAKNPTLAYRELDCNKKLFVPRHKMNPCALISQIDTYGGITCLVHPKTLRLSEAEFDEIISLFASVGLSCLEVYNPFNSDNLRRFYLAMCNKYDLIATVGSDDHEIAQRKVIMGHGVDNNLCIDDMSIIDQMKKRAKRKK